MAAFIACGHVCYQNRLLEPRNLFGNAAARLATGRNDLQIAHIDSEDLRGIDFRLLCSDKVFRKPAKFEMKGHTVHLRYAMRDIFEVRLCLPSSSFSSITGPHAKTACMRPSLRNTGRLVDACLKYSKQDYLTAKSPFTLDKLKSSWNRNLILMGDFNDEPWLRSILDYLQVSKYPDHLEEDM